MTSLTNFVPFATSQPPIGLSKALAPPNLLICSDIQVKGVSVRRSASSIQNIVWADEATWSSNSQRSFR